MNADVNCNAYLNNCSLFFGHFSAENILSINFKVHFPREWVGHYGILPVMNRSISMHFINFMYSIEESENSDAELSSVMEIFSEDELEEIWIKCFSCSLWEVPGIYRSRDRSVYLWILSIDSKQKWFLHNHKNMIFIVKNNYILWSIINIFNGLNNLFYITRLFHINHHL